MQHLSTLLLASVMAVYSLPASAAAPRAPTSLAVKATSSSGIDVTWLDNATDETGYELERRPSTSTLFKLVATLGANTSSYSDAGLSTAAKYYYRVRAYNTTKSKYSNSAYTTTLSSAPAAPGNLAVSSTGQSTVGLSWSDNSSNETKFVLERKIGTTGTYAQIATPLSNTVSYTNSGLAQGTTYVYRIAATNSAGNSTYSNEVTATTTASLPTMPANLTLTAGNTQIALKWTDQASNETGFEVERKTGSLGSYAVIADLGTNAASYTDSNLNEGQQYFYRVRAKNSGGYSSYASAYATTLLSAPGSLGAYPVSLSLTPFQIDLAWQDNSNAEAGFKLEEATSATGPWTQVATLAANTTAYQRINLEGGKTYFYRLKAYAGTQESAYSTVASGITASPRVNQLPQPKGIYLLSDNSGVDGLSSLDSLDKPFIDGFAWRIGWRSLDKGTTAPSYDFTAVDNAIAGVQALQKKLNLALFVLEVPDYVKASAKGTWLAPGGKRGTTVETILPWDATSMAHYRNFLAALAAHEVFDSATGTMTPLRQHSALAHINAGILGLQSVRDNTGNLVKHPDFTRDTFKHAMIDSIQAMQANFPDRMNYVAYWGINDGMTPSYDDELLGALLDTFDGVGHPMIGFFNEALKGDSPGFNPYQSATKNGYYMMFQACGSWTLHDLCSWTPGDDSPANGMQYGRDNFGALYFEIYRNDLDNAAFQATFQQWHDLINN